MRAAGLVAGFAVVGSLLAGSCAAPPPPPGMPRLLVFGDSISVLGTDALVQALPDYSVTVNAVWGTSLEDRVGDAPAAAATHPNVAVINLGTNDAWATDANDPAIDPAVSTATLLSIVQAFSGTCTVLVEVHMGHPLVGTFSAASVNAINGMEAELSPHIVHWNTIGDSAGNIAEDGVHPSAEGQAALAAAIADAAHGCP